MRTLKLVFLGLAVLLGLGAGAPQTAGAITSGATTSGSVSSPSYREAWTFAGVAGQRVLITAVTTSGTMNTQITLKYPGTDTTEVSTSGDLLDWQLQRSGTYTFYVEDNGFNDAGTYALTYLNVTAGPLTSGPDPDGGGIASSQVTSGTMNGVSDIDAFTFSGTNGDRVLMDCVETGGASYNTMIVLYPPSGGALVAASGGGNRLDHQLTATGTWTIVIYDYLYDHTGNYSLSFLNVTAGPFTTGSDPDGGVTVISNQIKTGSFQAGVDFDAWQVSGSAGQRILVSAVISSGAADTKVSIYPPAGNPAEVTTTGDLVDLQLAASGTYTIVIEDNSNDQTGSYTMSFVNVTAGPHADAADPDGAAITSSQVKSGTMSGLCDIDAWTFSGTNGDRVLMDCVETGGASYNTMIVLYPPSGGALVAGSGGGNRLEHKLTATGTWTIVIYDYLYDHSGSYSLSFLNVTAGPFTTASDPDGGLTVISNQIKTGSFQAGVDFDAWQISGTAGQRILVSAVISSGAADTKVSIYPPAGNPAEVTTTGDLVDLQLAASGTYTIVIEDNSNDQTGSYTMSFVNVTAGPHADAGDPDGAAITSSEVKSGTMSGLCDIDAWTFSGTNGDRVLMDCVETGGASYNTMIVLYPPSGGALVAASGGGNRLEHQLTATGTWTIVIYDYLYDHSGSYSLSFLNVTAGPFTTGSDPDGGVTVISNQIKTGSFQAGVDFDAWQISGSAGQRILVSAVISSGAADTKVSIYPPAGNPAEVTTTGDLVDLQLAASGTYTIVIEDNSNDQTGSYTMSFVNVTAGPHADAADPDGAAITSSQVKSGTMSGLCDIDAWTFSGTNGDRVLMDCVETGGASYNTMIVLYPPSGGALVAASGGGNRLEHKLTATGTWTIVIYDYLYDHSGNYSLSFLNVTAGPFTTGSDPDGGLTVISNQIKTGSFQAGVDFDAWQISGSAGQRILVSAVISSGAADTKVSIYPPAGNPAEVTTTGDLVDLQLATSGTYTIVIEDNSNDQTGIYSMSFVNVTAGPHADAADPQGGPITSNAIKTGTMSGLCDIDAWTFSGTNGDRVLMDCVETAGASYNTMIVLYPPSGGALVAASGGGNRLEHRLTATGTWTIVIYDYLYDHSGNYSLAFLNVTAGPYAGAPESDGGPIAAGVTYNGAADAVADLDGWVFTGTATDTVTIVSHTLTGAMNTQITLYPPAGAAALVSTTGDSVRIPLTGGAGTYTIVIEDQSNDQTGTYSLRLTGVSAATDVSALSGPAVTMMSPASPSPFAGVTRLDFRLAQEGSVELRIYDVNGREIRTLVHGSRGAGLHPVTWDGRDQHGVPVASGTYYARFVAAGVVKSQKVVCMR